MGQSELTAWSKMGGVSYGIGRGVSRSRRMGRKGTLILTLGGGPPNSHHRVEKEIEASLLIPGVEEIVGLQKKGKGEYGPFSREKVNSRYQMKKKKSERRTIGRISEK